MTKIILIRHGETEWNLEGRCQGHLDSPLTKNGVAQAKAAAKSFLNQKISLIYSSDLGRAFTTAEHISESTGVDIVVDKRLRERHCGIFQGLTMSDIQASLPDQYHNFLYKGPDHQIPEGESERQIYERCISCINEIAHNHPGETLVVVTHGGVLENMFRYVIGIPLEAPRMFKLWNTGKNIFSYLDGKWELLTFGDIQHLN